MSTGDRWSIMDEIWSTQFLNAPLDDSKKKSIVEIAKTNYGVYFTVKGNKKLGVLGNFDFTINW